MPEYLSPGVYVEEVASETKPIAGVSTSTAAFVGVVPDQITMLDENPNFDPTRYDPKKPDPNNLPSFSWTFPVTDTAEVDQAKADFDKAADELKAARSADPPKDPTAFAAFAKDFQTKNATVNAFRNKLARANSHSQAGTLAQPGKPVLCTTFGDFTRSFGGFSDDPDHKNLAHGVFGFFNNGGTRCWVMRYRNLGDLRDPTSLVPLEPIDEISLVVAPGITDPVVQTNLVDHCTNLADRFAILDGPKAPADSSKESLKTVHDTDYAALYFPWIKIFDKATQLKDPNGDGEALFAPSGHIAGIYSRVDHERGVHKAPANEVIRGATDIAFQISKNVQDGLNPSGVNCIRNINDNFTVWGARTVGGDVNADLKYINVRRTLIFLRKSIDQGTQWVVFEPNDQSLWAKIVRNITAFLTVVWGDGALFGSTPQEAFYVKCDAETNPPQDRNLGRVTTEIGVAIVRPAEFVIFHISQWDGPQVQ
jgi:phage tail sheath protein FI